MSKTAQHVDLEKVEQVEPNVDLHATNLHNPSHMEWTNDDRLLVTERTAGQITDITEGGDYEGAEPFAEGLEGPASMAVMPPDDGRILASECWAGRIKDVSGGGDVSDVEPFAFDMNGPYSLIRVPKDTGEQKLYATDSEGPPLGTRILDVTDGGAGDDHDVIVNRIPSRPKFPGMTRRKENWQKTWTADNVDCGYWGIAYKGNLGYVCGDLGQLVKAKEDDDEVVSHMEHLEAGNLLAEGLRRAGGARYNREDGLVYITEPHAGQIMAVDPERQRNYRFDPRVMQGLVYPTCVRFGPDNESMYVCGRGEGVVWRITDFRP